LNGDEDKDKQTPHPVKDVGHRKGENRGFFVYKATFENFRVREIAISVFSRGVLELDNEPSLIANPKSNSRV